MGKWFLTLAPSQMCLEKVLVHIYSDSPFVKTPALFFFFPFLFPFLSGFIGSLQAAAFILSFCLTSGHLKVNNVKGHVESVFA